MDTNPKLQTLVFDDKLDVQERLAELAKCKDHYLCKDRELKSRSRALSSSYVDLQKVEQIALMRRSILISQVGRPLEIASDRLKGTGVVDAMQENLTQQYVRLTKEQKLLWLNNLLFIMTPKLRELCDKIAQVRSYRPIGQQRNFLLAGNSGAGKTSFGIWYTWSYGPEVEAEYNHVPIVRFDAPEDNKSSIPLLQSLISAMGMTYLKGDTENELLKKAIAFIEQCEVELIIVDEVEHLVRHSLRRKLLEISNKTTGVPIICAACNPLAFIQGDTEIAGRWNDYFPLPDYRGRRLRKLLACIELLLPFSKGSALGEAEIKKPLGGGKVEIIDGPAKYIEMWTKGVLRDIMMLVLDASRCAIEQGEANLSTQQLQESWQRIQTESPLKKPDKGKKENKNAANDSNNDNNDDDDDDDDDV